MPGGDKSGQNQQTTGPDIDTVDFNTCGVGKNYPIRYSGPYKKEDGKDYSKKDDEEAIEVEFAFRILFIRFNLLRKSLKYFYKSFYFIIIKYFHRGSTACTRCAW